MNPAQTLLDSIGTALNAILEWFGIVINSILSWENIELPIGLFFGIIGIILLILPKKGKRK